MGHGWGMRPRVDLFCDVVSVRAVVSDPEIVFEESAAVAVRYDSRSPHVEVVAVGEEALALAGGFDSASSSRDAEGASESRVVELSQAPWWNAGALGSAEWFPPEEFEPRAHDGDVLVVWPLAPESFSAELLAVRLGAILARVQNEVGAKGPRRLREFLWFLTVRIDVRLGHASRDNRTHDDLVRAFRHILPGRVTMGDRALSLLDPPRLSDLEWHDWLVLGLGLAVQVAILGWLMMGGSTGITRLGHLVAAVALFVFQDLALHRLWYFRAPRANRRRRPSCLRGAK